MTREGHIIEAIAMPDNLRAAFWQAAKGKRAKGDCRRFQEGLDVHLEGLRADLLSGQAPVGEYHFFRIHDPKPRLICAAAFRERVLQHAVMNVCEPVLERAAVFDSYACRKGKGRLAAVGRARRFARRFEYFLKMDVRKYFDSVDHSVLIESLARKFKDAAVLELFERIIASYHTAPGKGLPIGNLTSQHFANFYLGAMDRYTKERLKRRGFVRYMDDCVVWGDSGRELRAVYSAVSAFACDHLKVEIKMPPIIGRTVHGMDFLGYRIYADKCRLARRSKTRFIQRLRRYEQAYLAGEWSELKLQQRVQALLAFVMKAQSDAFRRHVLRRFACVKPTGVAPRGSAWAGHGRGVVADGLEPRDPRGQLEQQRPELPVGEPQQQQPGQQEQQHRVPRCPGPSSIPRGGTDPDAILSCGDWVPRANSSTPPGVSRLDGVWLESSGRCLGTRESLSRETCCQQVKFVCSGEGVDDSMERGAGGETWDGAGRFMNLKTAVDWGLGAVAPGQAREVS